MTMNRTQLLESAARRATEYLGSVADRPVGATAAPGELARLLGGALPAAGADPETILDELADAARTGTVATQGPRYFGFVVGGSLPAATAADWLVSAWDQNAGLYMLSPLAAVAEEIAGGWIRDVVGLPASWSVGFVTGCQMANFTALATARHHVLRAVGWDVEEQGLVGSPPIDVLVNDESHYTVFTALRLLGLGAGRVHRVPADEQGRMRADGAARILDAGTGPCIVCAQAGNVNTGGFDPLPEIAEAAERRGAWLHVDGAFGLWAAASPVLSPLVAGLDRVDSIATDAHKWLNVPYDSGVVLVRHRESHRRAMTLSAAYIHATETERDPHEYVPEESRRARGVPVYAALRTLGRDGLRDLVERCCRLARRMADRLREHPEVRILNDVVLNQVLVQVAGAGELDADARTQQVIERVQADGTCWLGGTTWHGMRAIRIAVSNWSTTDDDADRSADAILRAIDG